jgi:hypothetical protein
LLLLLPLLLLLLLVKMLTTAIAFSYRHNYAVFANANLKDRRATGLSDD